MDNLKKIQEEYLGKLWQQLEAAYQKLARVDGAEKVRVQQEIEELNKLIQQGTSRLDGVEVAEGSSKPWEKDIPKINFSRVENVFKKILKQYEEDQLTACFLLQDSRSLGGKWCIEMLKQILKETGDWNDPYQITFFAHHQLNGKQFLDLIKLVDSPEDLETYTEKAIDRICSKIRSGSIIFFQIEIYSSPAAGSFLKWFIQDFWTLLVSKAAQLKTQYPLVKLVAVISATSRLSKESIDPEICCKNIKQFRGKTILELPLQKKWTQKEIEKWLLCFSRLNCMGIEAGRICEMSKNIYNDTEGNPLQVYMEIDKTITNIQQSQTNNR